MSQGNVAVVRDFYAAFNRGELSEMVACLTEDFVLLPPAYAVDGITHSGHDGFIAWFEGLGELWSSIQLRPTVRDAGERHVIADVTAELVGRGSGTPVTQRFWMLGTMDRGKIARSETFASEALALEAIGLREQAILISVGGVEQWWSDGERVRLPLAGGDRAIFVRRMGAGSTVTMLHGFPSSSHDWARVAPPLAERHALLLPDFLGFGASDKPAEHDYTLHEQADLVEALWEREGVNSTAVVAHDYAVSVTQELLARRAEGTLSTDLVAVHLLNGGLYPQLHRPEPVQTALLDPEQGPQVSAALTEELFVKALEPTFAEGFDAASDSAEIWQAMSRDDGQLIAHRLICYITDRKLHGERWVTALETTDVPVAFVWGMLDPVSGAHMAQRIRERISDAPFLALDDVGHWPPLEAPERVTAALLGQ